METYHHLMRADIDGTSCFSFHDEYSGHGPYNFYEGLVEHNNKRAIFVLWKSIRSQEEISELGILLAELLAADASLEIANDTGVPGNERYDRYQTAARLFEKNKIPQKLWSRRDMAASQAACDRFGREAPVLVPGYVIATTVSEHGRIVSEVDPVPRSDKRPIMRKLREREIIGKVDFW
ncbi:MAG: hypothetical protein ABH864_02950 [archaeon]